MLTEEQVQSTAKDMWALHLSEANELETIRRYVRGDAGRPSVPEGSEDEIEDLARLSVKNVLSVVVNSFAQNLSVVGYRSASATRDSAAWSLWQAQQMDARQAEVHRPALTYGAAYVTVLPGAGGPQFRPRSPRQLIAVYEDPQLDRWPQYALEAWTDTSGSKPRRRAYLLDSEAMYPLDLGAVTAYEESAGSLMNGLRVTEVGKAVRHGAGVCPVVRFINDRDAEDLVVGEVEPLITQQRAINSVNFDRLIVSRFGAFPQKVISGWSGTPSEVLRASSRRVWSFEDEVKTDSFAPANIDQYNNLLAEMLEHVAMQAQISPAQVTGKMVNLSAEALAAAEAAQQRKLLAKRESFGESWEQVLQLGARMAGIPATAGDAEAEVVWRDTEARSFSAIVDAVVKLVQVGVPIDLIISIVPGISQQLAQAIGDRVGQGADVLDALNRMAEAQGAQGSTITAGS